MSSTCFVLGGYSDPIHWLDVDVDDEDLIFELVSQAFYVDIDNCVLKEDDGEHGSSVYYALLGGDVDDQDYAENRIKESLLDFLGWLPEHMAYVVQSLTTEIRLVHELQAHLPSVQRSALLLSNAFYALRLRHDIIASIPPQNRQEGLPSHEQPLPHGYVCWMARTFHKCGHDESERGRWMKSFGMEPFEMYQRLAMSLGMSTLILRCIPANYQHLECQRQMRTAQDVTLGPWFGGLAENGVRKLGITLNRNPPESADYLGALRARIVGYSAHLSVSPHDKMHRPHWQEAVTRPKSYKTQWKGGFIPAPTCVADNRSRYPWPSLSEWKQKLMPGAVSANVFIAAHISEYPPYPLIIFNAHLHPPLLWSTTFPVALTRPCPFRLIRLILDPALSKSLRYS
jgi:hypothetical protein